MIPVSVGDELTIARPRRDVFEVLADQERRPAWTAGIRRVRRRSPGAGTGAGTGAVYAVVGRLAGRRVESTYEVTACEPPGVFSGLMTSDAFTFRESYSLEETDKGTVVRLEAEARPGRRMRWLWPLVAVALPRQVRADHRRLKGLLEHRPPPVTAA